MRCKVGDLAEIIAAPDDDPAGEPNIGAIVEVVRWRGGENNTWWCKNLMPMRKWNMFRGWSWVDAGNEAYLRDSELRPILPPEEPTTVSESKDMKVSA